MVYVTLTRLIRGFNSVDKTLAKEAHRLKPVRRYSPLAGNDKEALKVA